MLTNDIAQLMAMIPLEDVDNREIKNGDIESVPIEKNVQGLANIFKYLFHIMTKTYNVVDNFYLQVAHL